MFKIRREDIGAIVIFLCVVLIPLICLSYTRHQKANNPCILNTPREIGYGRIIHRKGLLTSPAPRYVVYYKGNTKETGEVCVIGTIVTEKQYGYLMYRNNE